MTACLWLVLFLSKRLTTYLQYLLVQQACDPACCKLLFVTIMRKLKKKKPKNNLQQLTTTYNNSNNKSIATFSLVLKRNLMQVKPLRLSLYSSVYEARPEQTLFSYNLSNRTLSGPWKVRWTPASSSKLKFITSTKSSTTGGLII